MRGVTTPPSPPRTVPLPSLAPRSRGSGEPKLSGLVRWHTALGEKVLRLFLLNLLWMLGTLSGAVVLGIFPATAAVHAVLRGDELERAAEADSELGTPRNGPAATRRPKLWPEFWGAWRSELGRGNRIGFLLLAGWAVIATDRWALTALDLGAAGPWVSGIVVLLTVLLALLTAVIWPLAAHFSDPLPRLTRIALTLLLARPALTLSMAAVLAATAWGWQTLPGLAPVFGIVLPCWALTFLLWRSGVLPRA